MFGHSNQALLGIFSNIILKLVKYLNNFLVTLQRNAAGSLDICEPGNNEQIFNRHLCVNTPIDKLRS
jgi:hypothetical protein